MRIVERVIADGARDAIKAYSDYVLSESGDEDQTLPINAPIRHITNRTWDRLCPATALCLRGRRT